MKQSSTTSRADSPRASVEVDDRIREQVEGLVKFPEMGSTGRVKGTRELVIQGTPYIAAYTVRGQNSAGFTGAAWCAVVAERVAWSW